MSFQAMTWALEQRTEKPTQKLLLLLLANYADADGWCFPSRRLLATEAGMSVRTIDTHLHALAEADLLSIQSRKRPNGSFTSNGYQLAVGGSANSAPPPADIAPPSADSAPLEPVIDPVTEPSPLSPSETSPQGEDHAREFHKLPGTYGATFQAFWEAYPRKQAIGHAREAFEVAIRRAGDPNVVVDGARRFAASLPADQDLEYVPKPKTWLEGESWKDEYPSRSEASLADRLVAAAMKGDSDGSR